METNNETKNKKGLFIGIAIAVVVILILVLVSGGDSSSNETNNADGSETAAATEIENTTDLSTLKQSEYTSTGFESVEMGDSKSTVEEKVGELTSIDSDTEYDVYFHEDTEAGSQYVFYFDGDALAEVSVYLI